MQRSRRHGGRRVKHTRPTALFVIAMMCAVLATAFVLVEGGRSKRTKPRSQLTKKSPQAGVSRDFSEFIMVMAAIMTCVIAPVFMCFVYSIYKDPAVPELRRAAWRALKGKLLSYLGQPEQQSPSAANTSPLTSRITRRKEPRSPTSYYTDGLSYSVRAKRPTIGIVGRDQRNNNDHHEPLNNGGYSAYGRSLRMAENSRATAAPSSALLPGSGIRASMRGNDQASAEEMFSSTRRLSTAHRRATGVGAMATGFATDHDGEFGRGAGWGAGGLYSESMEGDNPVTIPGVSIVGQTDYNNGVYKHAQSKGSRTRNSRRRRGARVSTRDEKSGMA